MRRDTVDVIKTSGGQTCETVEEAVRCQEKEWEEAIRELRISEGWSYISFSCVLRNRAKLIPFLKSVDDQVREAREEFGEVFECFGDTLEPDNLTEECSEEGLEHCARVLGNPNNGSSNTASDTDEASQEKLNAFNRWFDEVWPDILPAKSAEERSQDPGAFVQELLQNVKAKACEKYGPLLEKSESCGIGVGPHDPAEGTAVLESMVGGFKLRGKGWCTRPLKSLADILKHCHRRNITYLDVSKLIAPASEQGGEKEQEQGQCEGVAESSAPSLQHTTPTKASELIPATGDITGVSYSTPEGEGGVLQDRYATIYESVAGMFTLHFLEGDTQFDVDWSFTTLSEVLEACKKRGVEKVDLQGCVGEASGTAQAVHTPLDGSYLKRSVDSEAVELTNRLRTFEEVVQTCNAWGVRYLDLSEVELGAEDVSKG